MLWGSPRASGRAFAKTGKVLLLWLPDLDEVVSRRCVQNFRICKVRETDGLPRGSSVSIF